MSYLNGHPSWFKKGGRSSEMSEITDQLLFFKTCYILHVTRTYAYWAFNKWRDKKKKTFPSLIPPEGGTRQPTQNSEDKMSKTDNCIYCNTKLFTSLGLQNVECGKNQSECFPFALSKMPVDKLFFSVSLSPLLFVSFTLVFGLKLERRLASVSG